MFLIGPPGVRAGDPLGIPEHQSVPRWFASSGMVCRAQKQSREVGGVDVERAVGPAQRRRRASRGSSGAKAVLRGRMGVSFVHG